MTSNHVLENIRVIVLKWKLKFDTGYNSCNCSFPSILVILKLCNLIYGLLIFIYSYYIVKSIQLKIKIYFVNNPI